MPSAKWQPFCLGLNIMIFIISNGSFEVSDCENHENFTSCTDYLLICAQLDFWGSPWKEWANQGVSPGHQLPLIIHWCCFQDGWRLPLLNTLRPKQHGCHFADNTFKGIFFNENVGISIKISLEFVHKGPINNIPALVQIMAWRRIGDKPLPEPMLTQFTDAYMRH